MFVKFTIKFLCSFCPVSSVFLHYQNWKCSKKRGFLPILWSHGPVRCNWMHFDVRLCGMCTIFVEEKIACIPSIRMSSFHTVLPVLVLRLYRNCQLWVGRGCVSLTRSKPNIAYIISTFQSRLWFGWRVFWVIPSVIHFHDTFDSGKVQTKFRAMLHPSLDFSYWFDKIMNIQDIAPKGGQIFKNNNSYWSTVFINSY